MRVGRAGTPWDFVPLALTALRVKPDDVEMRCLLAAAYARVGLKTAAHEQMSRLSPAVRTDEGVVALSQAVAALPDDRVRADALLRTLAPNLEALRRRPNHAVDLRPEVSAWQARVAQREHFRTSAGDIVWRTIGAPDGWQRFGNQAEQAKGVRLPHDDRPTAAAYPPWYIVEGIDPPWILKRVFASTGTRADGFAPHVLLVQQSPAQLLDGLAQADLTRELADERVLVFAGVNAASRIATYLGDRAAEGARIAAAAIGLPTTTDRVAPSPQQMVAGATAAAERLTTDARARVEATYSSRDRAWWARRFAGAMTPGGTPLRVLIITSRFSTFLRHSAADLAKGFEEAGTQARVLMEPDDHSLGEPLSRLLAIADFKPDLVLVPNYLRRDLRESLPDRVPFATWVQDAMPHLYDAAAGSSMGELDFVVGNLSEDLFQRFGYPRGRSLALPMAASSQKFHSGPVDERLAARHACEIAYVSHHSETPEAMLARKVGEAGGTPALARAMAALFERVRELVDRPVADGPITPRLRTATVEELARVGMPTDDRTVSAALTTFAMPLADRTLRHRTLEWAATIARERGWRMHLYGRGWESHPTLAPLARGEIEHGEDLRACYRSARIHLHISLHTAIHQRVFECGLSGGLPLCRLMADDLSHLEYLAAAHASRRMEPAVCDPWRRAAMGYQFLGYRPDSCEDGLRFTRLHEQVGLPAPAFVWLNQIHAERLRASSHETIDGEGRSLWDLWPDPGSLMFHDRDSMRRVLLRAIEDPAWREVASNALAERARRTVTYEAFARATLDFVARGLAPSSAGESRWYDTRAGGMTKDLPR